MPLQATSGAASYDAFGGGVPSEPNYIESVFSCFLYTGNGSTQTITNGIDLAGKGGLVWGKDRGDTVTHGLVDSARGTDKSLSTANTNAQGNNSAPYVPTFLSTGYITGLGNNEAAHNFVSWTFRKQPKFFDVVTYTGTGVARTVAHNLGSVPGCIIVKSTSGAGAWVVYHRGVNSGTNPQNYAMTLNATAAQYALTNFWNDTAPTSTVFTVGAAGGETNETGVTYVAYLFAHNAGGFGLTGTDNVISCGTFNSTALNNLGWEPQFVMMKRTDSTSGWFMFDNMRELTAKTGFTNPSKYLYANTSDAETDSTGIIGLDPLGFSSGQSGTYIYIAIRRGPMKVPTSGTSVFSPNTTTNDTVISTTGFPVDLCIEDIRTPSSYPEAFDRLRGSGIRLLLTSTDAEGNTGTNPQFQSNTGVTPNRNGPPTSCILWNFRRAPSFFDEVCYTGTGSARTINHNLTVAPELVIIKSRSNAVDWVVGNTSLGFANFLMLNRNDASGSASSIFNNTAPTASVFSVGASSGTNEVTLTYVAYLFATCAGVSKVGSYTGTGTTLQIDCGFTGGARFVLIKRTDSTGAWYVWDSARGIVSGNDPYLLLNSTAAEVTNTDYVDTYSAGFEISSTAPAAINASGGTFIFLAIA